MSGDESGSQISDSSSTQDSSDSSTQEDASDQNSDSEDSSDDRSEDDNSDEAELAQFEITMDPEIDASDQKTELASPGPLADPEFDFKIRIDLGE
jgi:hypothetical protein